MPQKRNPDAAELVRAKSGRVIGALTALLVALKGLPLAYGKDMPEDKEPVFATVDTLELSVAAVAGMVRDLQPDLEAMRRACQRGFLTATDLADWLVRKTRTTLPPPIRSSGLSFVSPRRRHRSRRPGPHRNAKGRAGDHCRSLQGA